jgi:WD40 repeat protein
MNDNNFLLVSSLNNQIQVIDIIKEEEIAKFTGHVHSRFLMDISTYYTNTEEKAFIFTGSEDGHIYYWNVEEDDICYKLKTNFLENTSINCMSHNNADLIICSGFPDIKNSINVIKIHNSSN